MVYSAIILGAVLSTLYGALFHLWRGGGFGRLLLYLLLGWTGFWIGNSIAGRFGWSFGSLGPLHIATGTVFSFLFLAVGYWLSLVEVDKKG